jgi:hypothetical protein
MIFLGFALIFFGLISDQDIEIRILLVILGILLIFITLPGFKKLKKEKFGD